MTLSVNWGDGSAVQNITLPGGSVALTTTGLVGGPAITHSYNFLTLPTQGAATSPFNVSYTLTDTGSAVLAGPNTATYRAYNVESPSQVLTTTTGTTLSGLVGTTDDGAAVIHVKGKGGKDRSVPIEAELLSVIEAYLDSRAIRFPGDTKRKADGWDSALSRWPGRSPLFVGRDGERITRGTLQSRINRAFKRAGPDAQPVPGAMVHGLRHTYATELAGSDVSVYTLMKLLGHESMTTSQRYVTAAGSETRSAAARNGLYALIPDGVKHADRESRLDRDL